MYDYASDVDYQAVGTKVRTWTSGDTRYTETSYFDVGRKLHVNYNGIPVDASIAMEDGIMDLMEPYDYYELMTHDNKFLSGYEAETYNMPPNEVEPRAQAKANKANREWVRRSTSEYTSFMNERLNSSNKLTGTKFALMPVWIYEYRFQGENYKFYVNGQTGKCVGTPPKSIGKAVGLTALLLGSAFVFLDGLSMLLGVL